MLGKALSSELSCDRSCLAVVSVNYTGSYLDLQTQKMLLALSKLNFALFSLPE